MIKIKFTIGIDEVGRGPVAGPVAIGAVMVAKENLKKVEKEFSHMTLTKNKNPQKPGFCGFRDSKKMTPKMRNEWFERIKHAQQNDLLDYKVVFVENDKIDKFGIAPSIKSCVAQSLKSLSADVRCLQINPQKPDFCGNILVLLDGGLKAPEEFVNQKSIIKGDEKELLIALASIVAKVNRDALMCNFAKKYLEYGFEKHKGYGTKLHYEMIRKYGLCDIHRKSFLSRVNQE